MRLPTKQVVTPINDKEGTLSGWLLIMADSVSEQDMGKMLIPVSPTLSMVWANVSVGVYGGIFH